MRAQYGFLVLFLTMSLSAQAEQAATDPLNQAGATGQAGMPETSPAPAAKQAGGAAATRQQMTEQAGFSTGTVARAALTSAVENREPTDKLETVSTDQQQLYFFTELRDMSGQTAKHRWEHNGKVMAEVEFNVKGPRWRVWSSKSFVPNWTGDWKVSVINGAGDVIKEKTFKYETAAATQADEPAAASAPNAQ